MTAAAALLSGSAVAGTDARDVMFQEDFIEAAALSALPEGWKTYGIGKEPLDEFKELFTGEEPFYIVKQIGRITGAWSLSTFQNAETADEWLVTPKIHIDSEMALLSFEAASTGSLKSSDFRVYISESGDSKEDFSVIPELKSTLKGRGSDVY